MAQTNNKELGKLSFEQAIEQLRKIVERIEQGQISLEESLQQYEMGMALIKHCRAILQQAEKRIEMVSTDQQGSDQMPSS
ncbi:MAG: exodeoxyribonuclease VII small subunit [Sedimentisphaerales bacterium]|jgi:exodeoxyribonuclease VII small subunit|nr:exodeoxyribonuclease VII small subunit [Sedimentisphaerales bacterium]